MNGVDLVAENCTSPKVSVILNSFNRGERLAVAAERVLTQSFKSVELVIVDDGSSDDTVDVAATISDPRVTVVTQANRGLGAARLAGANKARGEWLVFLDDDDRPLSGWLEGLLGWSDDQSCAIACCGAQYVTPNGAAICSVVPRHLGALYSDSEGLFLAGTFAVRRSIYEASGGYLPGMPCSHQTELGIRLARCASEAGMSVASNTDVLIEIERREPGLRPLSSAEVLFWGSRWLLSRHAEAFESAPGEAADNHGIAGVSAFRLGNGSAARRHFLKAGMLKPMQWRRWGRLGLSCVTPLGKRVWGNTSGIAPQHPLRRAATFGTDVQMSNDVLFLPWTYRSNEQRSSDAQGTPFWEGGLQANDVAFQDPVYRYAAKLVRRRGLTRVVDVGCGSGDKVVHRIGAVTNDFFGVDQASGLGLAKGRFPQAKWIEGDFADSQLWQRLAALEPSLVICADVIEHVDDPLQLLHGLHTVLERSGFAWISTPDRGRLFEANPTGPPLNPRHVREWTAEEFELLLESVDLEVVFRRHLLPRSYRVSVLELKRIVWKVLHGRAAPDRRYNMAFLVRCRSSMAS